MSPNGGSLSFAWLAKRLGRAKVSIPAVLFWLVEVQADQLGIVVDDKRDALPSTRSRHIDLVDFLTCVPKFACRKELLERSVRVNNCSVECHPLRSSEIQRSPNHIFRCSAVAQRLGLELLDISGDIALAHSKYAIMAGDIRVFRFDVRSIRMKLVCEVADGLHTVRWCRFSGQDAKLIPT